MMFMQKKPPFPWWLSDYLNAGESLFQCQSVFEGVAHLPAYRQVVIVYRVEYDGAQLGRVDLALLS